MKTPEPRPAGQPAAGPAAGGHGEALRRLAEELGKTTAGIENRLTSGLAAAVDLLCQQETRIAQLEGRLELLEAGAARPGPRLITYDGDAAA